DQIPSYDEFLAGTYNNVYPDHYVFGYYLVAHARKIFGRDLWYKILDRVSDFSFNPYAISNAFKKNTGTELETFYDQTMLELKRQYQDPHFAKSNEEFRQVAYPRVDQNKLYYLKRTLNSFWGV